MVAAMVISVVDGNKMKGHHLGATKSSGGTRRTNTEAKSQENH